MNSPDEILALYSSTALKQSVEGVTVEKLAIVGLGYVGLPLAVAFGKRRPTLGMDLDETKLAHYRQGHDPSGEVEPADFTAAEGLEFSSDASRLAEVDIIIVAVPTPIDHARRPDLRALQGASRMIGANMRSGVTVVFESTVYPGCTEEVCVPILEEESGKTWFGRNTGLKPSDGFFIGYSPERINPGDTVHRIDSIIKVVAGDSKETTERLADLYNSVVDAGTYKTTSIRVAEAAKVIENTQRDINIALMNELALIFNRLGIDTLEVLEAAGTKWNFLPFRPGLVGGHCIGVDPYYLTYKAETVGHHPEDILSGRQTNDGMGKFIAEQTIKCLVKHGHRVSGSKIGILGLTFKEDCPDLRNSRVVDIIQELREYHCNVVIHDPLADPAEAEAEYGETLSDWQELSNSDALVLAVAHQHYRELAPSEFLSCLNQPGVVVDVKSILDRDAYIEHPVEIWRL